MKTYDKGASTFGKNHTLKSIKGLIKRWLDRERELISLRNAVGMMSEARRADAAEYHEMLDSNRRLRMDAARLRYLTEDFSTPAIRQRRDGILSSMPVRTYSGACLDIDAAMRELSDSRCATDS